MKPLKEAIQEAQNKLCSDYGLNIELKVIVRGLPEDERAKMVAIILDAIEKETAVTEAEIKSDSRKQRLCDARYIAMYLVRFKAMLNLKQAGFYLGRDHTTVLHGIGRYFELMQVDENFRQTVERVVKHLPEPEKENKSTIARMRYTKAA